MQCWYRFMEYRLQAILSQYRHITTYAQFQNYINTLKLISLAFKIPHKEQVDILISKNQALQILYLKHCVYKT